MTAPIPYGLFNVTSTVRVEPAFSDPADVIFERLQTLRNFWKVHNAQSRVSRDAVNIRSGQLFWRVWGNPRLSVTLKQSTLIQLWMKCQQDIDLAPFDLHLPCTLSKDKHLSQSSPTNQSVKQQGASNEYEKSRSPFSLSPSDLNLAERSLEDIEEHLDESNGNRRTSSSTQQTGVRPTPNRSISNGGSSSGTRKRTSFQATNTRGRTRPSIVRKRSSQSQQTSDLVRTRSALKSPQSTTEGTEVATGRKLARTLSSQIPPSADATVRSSRTMSALELPSALPSASSWQSVDSHADPRSTSTGPKSTSNDTALLIDKNFREKFVEHQKKINSSTDLAGMNKIMRKTGSVVRFVDEVDMAEGSQQSRVIRPDSAQNQRKPDGLLQSWRPNLQRHDSIGSVAAVSDDESEDEEASQDDLVMLPRTRSQLSLGIADLKRSQSVTEKNSRFAVTSPEIEVEQDALIRGKTVKIPTEEEEKLLAMGRKDGVTRAGGVNLPRELTVRGTFDLSEDSDSSEQPLY